MSRLTGHITIGQAGQTGADQRATQKRQSCERARPPTMRAGPVLRPTSTTGDWRGGGYDGERDCERI